MILRKWAIPDSFLMTARFPKGSERHFLQSIGVDVSRRWDTTQSPEYWETTVVQPRKNQDPSVLSPLERKILEDIVPDEDLWEYQPALHGPVFNILPPLPVRVVARFDPTKTVEVKRLQVETLWIQDRFEVAELLVAVDEDSLKVYWNRKA